MSYPCDLCFCTIKAGEEKPLRIGKETFLVCEGCFEASELGEDEDEE